MGCFSGSSQKSTSTSTSYTPEQKKWLSSALDIYGPALGQGQDVYQGLRLAPMTPTQTEALDMGDFLSLFSPDAEMPLFGETGTALSGILSGETGAQPYSPEMTADLFSRIYEKPAQKHYRETVLPTTQEAYAGPGFWGTARARAEMESSQDLADWLGTKRGEMEWSVEEANRQIAEAKAQRAAGIIPTAMAYGQQPTQEALNRLAGRAGIFDFASVEQQQRQREIDVAMNKFLEENRITDPENIQILLSLLGMSYSTSTATGTASGPGLGYMGAGSLFTALGGGLGGAMMTPST